MPVLIIQGEGDQYGTVRQIEIAQEECYCPVEVLMLPDTKHVPFREAPKATLEAVVDFTQRALQAEPTPLTVAESLRVIPGRREAASPESITPSRGYRFRADASAIPE